MKNSNASKLIIGLILTVNGVWALDSLVTGPRVRADRRAEELLRRYGCEVGDCYPDFDGDGRGDLLTYSYLYFGEMRLSAYVQGDEVLRLRYGNSPGRRTRIALNRSHAKARLLIYDGTGYRPLKAVLEWDERGRQLVQTPPSGLEREILDAMDDRVAGPRARESRATFRKVRIVAYLSILLVATVALVLRRRCDRLALP